MTPQSLYNAASETFHNGEFSFYPVDSVPFADDLPAAVGVRLGKAGALLPCRYMPEPIKVFSATLPAVRGYYLEYLHRCLVGD